jgi:hypothetical protein
MRLNHALNRKNSLAGELARLQTIFQRENSRRELSASTVDREALLNQIAAARQRLIAIKSAITQANIDIYPKIAEMSELKSYITELSILNTKHGVHSEVVSLHQAEPRDVRYDAYLTREKVDALTAETQKRIDQLQEEIDEYNASHSIALEM